MYQPPSNQEYRQAAQAGRERYARLESEAARRSELGIQKPPKRLRKRIRHWYRRLTGTPEAIGSHAQDDANDL
ncbi:MAG: hypothetical protein ACRDOB_06215 [Streptosporangiaceae bacterium]